MVKRNVWSNIENGYIWFSLLYSLINLAWKATFGSMSKKKVFQFMVLNLKGTWSLLCLHAKHKGLNLGL